MSNTEEYTGGSVSYYAVDINSPVNAEADPYTAECQDIIEALGMDFNEGSAFKAIWRRAAARTLGKRKKGYDEGLYDAQKVEFYGARIAGRAAVKPVGAPEWAAHDGEGCPVREGVLVELRHRDGTISVPDECRPNGIYWRWADTPGECRLSDVVAYRLA